MILNPKILQIIKELKLPTLEVKLFCLLWWFKRFDNQAEQLLFTELPNGKKIINFNNEEIYRINFLKLEEGELQLRYPLFIKENNNSFEDFAKKLSETRLLNSRGHVNQPQDYAVYDVSKETKEAFNTIEENLDLDKAVEVVLRYYESTKPAQKLSNYLTKGFIVDYQIYY